MILAFSRPCMWGSALESIPDQLAVFLVSIGLFPRLVLWTPSLVPRGDHNGRNWP